MKRLVIYILSVLALLFTNASSLDDEEETEILYEDLQELNGYEDTFYDENGNKTELEYIVSEDTFRINTYVNDEIITILKLKLIMGSFLKKKLPQS